MLDIGLVRAGGGLPYGKVDLRTKGLRISAENASLRASIWVCISGIGQELVHCSRMRICLVK